MLPVSRQPSRDSTPDNTCLRHPSTHVQNRARTGAGTAGDCSDPGRTSGSTGITKRPKKIPHRGILDDRTVLIR